MGSWGPLASGAHRASGVAAGAVLSLCSLCATPQQGQGGYFLCAQLISWLSRGNSVVFPLSAILEWGSMINPSPAV